MSNSIVGPSGLQVAFPIPSDLQRTTRLSDFTRLSNDAASFLPGAASLFSKYHSIGKECITASVKEALDDLFKDNPAARKGYENLRNDVSSRAAAAWLNDYAIVYWAARSFIKEQEGAVASLETLDMARQTLLKSLEVPVDSSVKPEFVSYFTGNSAEVQGLRSLDRIACQSMATVEHMLKDGAQGATPLEALLDHVLSKKVPDFSRAALKRELDVCELTESQKVGIDRYYHPEDLKDLYTLAGGSTLSEPNWSTQNGSIPRLANLLRSALKAPDWIRSTPQDEGRPAGDRVPAAEDGAGTYLGNDRRRSGEAGPINIINNNIDFKGLGDAIATGFGSFAEAFKEMMQLPSSPLRPAGTAGAPGGNHGRFRFQDQTFAKRLEAQSGLTESPNASGRIYNGRSRQFSRPSHTSIFNPFLSGAAEEGDPLTTSKIPSARGRTTPSTTRVGTGLPSGQPVSPAFGAFLADTKVDEVDGQRSTTERDARLAFFGRHLDGAGPVPDTIGEREQAAVDRKEEHKGDASWVRVVDRWERRESLDDSVVTSVGGSRSSAYANLSAGSNGQRR